MLSKHRQGVVMLQIDPEDERKARNWVIGAGIFTVLFSCFIYMSDEGLSNSDREQKLGRKLHELRLAQTSLDSGVNDKRQTLHLAGRADVTDPNDHSHDQHASHDHDHQAQH